MAEVGQIWQANPPGKERVEVKRVWLRPEPLIHNGKRVVTRCAGCHPLHGGRPLVIAVADLEADFTLLDPLRFRDSRGAPVLMGDTGKQQRWVVATGLRWHLARHCAESCAHRSWSAYALEDAGDPRFYTPCKHCVPKAIREEARHAA